MAKQINLVPPMSGTMDLYTHIRMIEDKGYREKIKKYLSDMEEGRKEYNEAVEAYGKAQDLDDLLSKAREDEYKARETLIAAEQTAEKLVEETESVLAVQQHELETEVALLRERIITRDKTESSRKRAMTIREAAVEKSLEDLARREEVASRKTEEALELTHKYEEAIKRLEDAGVKV